MQTINDYSLCKTAKINGVSVRIFFKDEDSAPLICFSDLLTAINGVYKHDVSLYAKQIKEEHKVLVNYRAIKYLAIDFEATAKFIHDKLEEKFANQEVAGLSRAIDKLAHELPGPVKEYRKEDKTTKRECDNVEQIMTYIDGKPLRYLKADGIRWFNGVDLRTIYCGGNQEIFDDVTFDLDSEDVSSFKDVEGLFVREMALETFLSKVNPDEAGELFTELIDSVMNVEEMLEGLDLDDLKELDKLDDEAQKELEELEPVDPDDVEKDEDNEVEIEFLMDVTDKIHEYHDSVTGDTFHFFTRDEDGRVFISFPDLRACCLREDFIPHRPDCVEEIQCIVNDKEMIFLEARDSLNWYLKANEFADFYKRFMDFVNSSEVTHVEKESVVSFKGAPTERLDLVKNKKDEVIGKTVGWIDLSIDKSRIFTVLVKKEEDLFNSQGEIFPMFKALDVAEFCGFTQGATIAKRFTSDNEYAKTSVRELRRNGVTLVTYRGIVEMIDGFESVTTINFSEKCIPSKIVVDRLRSAVDSWLNENRTKINFELEKKNVQEQEATKLETKENETKAETGPNLTQEQASDAVKQALSDPDKRAQINDAINQLPGGLGAMAAGLLGALANNQQEKKQEDDNTYFDTVTVNGVGVRVLIVKSPKGGITPYFEVSDFAKAWKLDVTELTDKITDNHHPYEESSNGERALYLLYAELSEIALQVNSEGRTMVSNTMKSCGEVFKSACRKFGIDFADDTKAQKQETATEEIDTSSPGSMAQLLSRTDDGHAYTIGAIMLAERLRALLTWFKNTSGAPDIEHLPGPTNANVVKNLWTYISTQEPTQEPGFSMQRAVITAYERYTILSQMAQGLRKH